MVWQFFYFLCFMDSSSTAAAAAADPANLSATQALHIAWAGMAALAVAMGIGRFAFTPLLPMMLHDGVVDIAAGSWLATANYFGYLVGALLFMSLPWLGRRLGPMPGISSSLPPPTRTLARCARMPVMAKRCASSRICATSISAAESEPR